MKNPHRHQMGCSRDEPCLRCVDPTALTNNHLGAREGTWCVRGIQAFDGGGGALRVVLGTSELDPEEGYLGATTITAVAFNDTDDVQSVTVTDDDGTTNVFLPVDAALSNTDFEERDAHPSSRGVTYTFHIVDHD